MRPSYSQLLEWVKPEPPSVEDVKCMKLLKPGDYEIYTDRLYNYVLEGTEVFIRTGTSEWIRSGDLIVGIHNPAGDIVCASTGTFLHAITSVPPIKFAVANWLHELSVGVKEGDVFYCNDAAYGGMHNADQTAFMPVFHDGELIAWTTATVHQPETGSTQPGGMSPSLRTRYEEGMKTPPIKVGENYMLREDLMEMFANIVFRTPRMQIADMKARFTACDRVRIRVQELAREKGNAFLRGLFATTIKNAEEAARRRVSQWNDGTYRAVTFFDTAGFDHTLIRCYMTVHKKGDSLIIDLAGTSPEHDGGSQQGMPHHCAAEAALVFCPYIFHDLPVCNAAFAPLNWMVPDGCVFSASPEAATANIVSIGVIVAQALAQTVAKMAFDSEQRSWIVAPSGGGSGLLFSGINQYGIRVSAQLTYSINADGQGGRVDMDGIDALGCLGGYMPGAKGIDVEDAEESVPILILSQPVLTDSCGFGKNRGGYAISTAQAVHLTDRGSYVSTGRESKTRSAQGLFGGYPGAVKVGIEIKNTDLWHKMSGGDKDFSSNVREMITKRPIKGDYIFRHNQRPPSPLNHGDIFINMSSGGAGYGDVLERDPEKVVKDLRKGVISSWTAENVFHVAYSAETLEVDYERTEELRQKARETRKARGKRYDEFLKEWSQKRPPDSALKHYGSWPDAKKVREIRRG